jgi:hypothetical protein
MGSTMIQKTRALVYVRKSMVRERRDEISPERQLANCLEAVQKHGWHTEPSDIYRDAEGHRSGRSEDHRPAWQALKERVRLDPSVAAVVVNSLDRGSRSRRTSRLLAVNEPAVIGSLRSAAFATGAAFVDQRALMGGEGSIRSWARRGLAARDLVHLSRAGYERVASALVDRLLLGYEPRGSAERSGP